MIQLGLIDTGIRTAAQSCCQPYPVTFWDIHLNSPHSLTIVFEIDASIGGSLRHIAIR